MTPRMPQRRILVAGCGSIGRRHAKNLLVLGQEQLMLVDPDPAARARACAEFGLPGGSSIEEGLAWGPAAVVVANPTAEHVPTALAAVRRGCHVFIEKPLGHTLEGVEELLRVVHERQLVTLVGCNLRFHPGPRLVQGALAAGTLGRVLSARLEVGSYLPSWRPGTDYRQSYSARQALGGGCILDAIHELDLACWYFGFPREVFVMATAGVSLNIETEAVAEILLRYPDDLVVSIHLDYVQRWRQRRCEIIGEHGTIAWESRQADVRIVRGETGEPERLGYELDYEINCMYQEEMQHFLQCLDRVESPAADVAWASQVTRVALAAKASAASSQPVSLSSETMTLSRP